MSSPTDPQAAAAAAALSAEAEALLRARHLQLWDNFVHGAAQDSAALYRRHAVLFEAEALEALRRARSEAAEDPGQGRALDMLEACLLAEQVARRTCDVSDALANLDATAEVECDGNVFPYRRLPLEVVREADPARRRRLHAAAAPVLERLNPLLVERQRQGLAAARALGFADLVDLAGRVRQCDLRALGRLAEQALEATESAYQALLAEVGPRESGVPLPQMRACDLQYLVRGRRHERSFEAGQLLPSLRTTLRGLGIYPDAQSGLTIDSEDRPGKLPRAFCLAVSVPDDVRLSFRPAGGAYDYDCLYHEMGHAQHYLNIRQPSFEFRQLGSAAISETFALLFEGWTATVPWLRRATSMPDRQRHEFRAMRGFRLLYLVRRYSARLLYELGLHAGDVAGAPEAYRRLQERALRVPLEEADALRYLADVDDLFYGAEYLRGWLLEAALERVLRAKYGETWFDHAGAGAYLTRLWEKGGRPRAEELMEKLGVHRWNLDLLLQRVRSLCTVS